MNICKYCRLPTDAGPCPHADCGAIVCALCSECEGEFCCPDDCADCKREQDQGGGEAMTWCDRCCAFHYPAHEVYLDLARSREDADGLRGRLGEVERTADDLQRQVVEANGDIRVLRAALAAAEQERDLRIPVEEIPESVLDEIARRRHERARREAGQETK